VQVATPHEAYVFHVARFVKGGLPDGVSAATVREALDPFRNLLESDVVKAGMGDEDVLLQNFAPDFCIRCV
jgi:hypothetical protein